VPVCWVVDPGRAGPACTVPFCGRRGLVLSLSGRRADARPAVRPRAVARLPQAPNATRRVPRAAGGGEASCGWPTAIRALRARGRGVGRALLIAAEARSAAVQALGRLYSVCRWWCRSRPIRLASARPAGGCGHLPPQVGCGRPDAAPRSRTPSLRPGVRRSGTVRRRSRDRRREAYAATLAAAGHPRRLTIQRSLDTPGNLTLATAPVLRIKAVTTSFKIEISPRCRSCLASRANLRIVCRAN